MLEKIGHFKASELLLVGGGSRNTLWNQIKANMLDIPVKFSTTPKRPSQELRCSVGMA